MNFQEALQSLQKNTPRRSPQDLLSLVAVIAEQVEQNRVDHAAMQAAHQKAILAILEKLDRVLAQPPKPWTPPKLEFQSNRVVIARDINGNPFRENQ